MNTPIADFIDRYAASGISRLHMPGHKGFPGSGMEAWDLTEISGADSLYEANGIIRESEKNAAGLFGSAATFYSCEGSSLCIRAMLRLLIQNRAPDSDPLIIAARNVHKSFVSAAALLGIDVQWIPRGAGTRSVCALSADTAVLESMLRGRKTKPAAVYVTSPDYLGGMADIPALAKVCHQYGIPLAVDNAHGAYLRFLEKSLHPLQLGADLCCDSAHKTLPVLTGGAYLHIAHSAPAAMADNTKTAMALFGSTSPSYLILRSLDQCNRILETEFSSRLSETVSKLSNIRSRLHDAGVQIKSSDPLKLTVEAPADTSGYMMADALRKAGAECEYADRDYVVLMFTPYNSDRDFSVAENTIIHFAGPQKECCAPFPQKLPERITDMRTSILGTSRYIDISDALGCICADPLVSCPPAVPIVMPGERIDRESIDLLAYYGYDRIAILN